MLLYILLPILLVGLDQAVKHWASAALQGAGTMPLIEGVFHLTYAENTGAAFSLLQGGRTFFLIITPLAMLLLALAARKGYFPNRLSRIAFAFIVGGTLGNFIDRARQGFVVDMFDFRLINFAIFNVADVALTIGVGLFILHTLLYKEPAKEEPHGDDSPDSDPQ